MTTSATAQRALPSLDSLSRAMRGPTEGWFVLALVILMALIVGWSVDDPGWLGDRTKTDFLAPMGVLGVLTGFFVAKLGIPRWRGHVVAALVAALVVPTVVGSVLLAEGASIGQMYGATAESMVAAWIDLAHLNKQFTSETGHFLLTLGLLVWGTGQFAAYSVFGHRRPLDAVIVVGVVLLGSMASTVLDQFWYLVLFSIAALLLLTRLHALEESAVWARRRIGDPAAVRSLYQTGGAIFVAVAIVLSLVLTTSASSAPLSGLLTGMERRLIELSVELQRAIPAAGSARSLGVTFGPTAPITGAWTPNNTTAMSIRLDPEEQQRFYWRVGAYDRFALNSWSFSDSDTTARADGETLLAAMADEPTQFEGRREISFIVSPRDYYSSYGVAPEGVVRVNRNATVLSMNEEGRFQAFDLGDRQGEYTVTASVPIVDEDDEGAVTQAMLQAAGQEYPEDILERYLQVPEGAVQDGGREIIETVLERAESDRPYDIAQAMETYLRSDAFTYESNVKYTNCDLGTVECFATTKVGYCMYYASAMAILLRDLGIPSRLAQGFLPGPRDPETGIESISNSGAHAWVEVFFPSYGWIEFDPTGGNLTPDANPPRGDTTETPRPSRSVPRVTPKIDTDDEVDPVPPRILPGANGGGGTSPAGFVAVGGLLALVIGGLAFIAWQRGPRGDVTPDLAWVSIAGLARRLGFGPRPTETVYEYAGALAEIVPESRVELDTVARAKVEVAYGRRDLGEDRLRALREAMRRLRVGLLRLAIRRRARAGRR